MKCEGYAGTAFKLTDIVLLFVVKFDARWQVIVFVVQAYSRTNVWFRSHYMRLMHRKTHNHLAAILWQRCQHIQGNHHVRQALREVIMSCQ